MSPVTAAYQALHESAAWHDVSTRARLRVMGEDRARLLHAMTTNHVEALQVGQGCYVFFLNAQGRILADATLLCFEDHILLDAEPELRTPIYEHLDRYIIADDVTLEDDTEKTATIAIEGPRAAETLAEFGAPVPADAYSWSRWDHRIVARLDTTGAGGFFVAMPPAEQDAFRLRLDRMQLLEAAPQDLRTVRIENGRPRYGEEITDRYLVQETDQMHAIHFSKGCYLGQEIVERVRSRGQVHRVLRRIEIDSEEPPPEGSKLMAAGAAAGEIASAVFSPRRGKSVALAYVRTQLAVPGAELTVNSAPARVL
jgi:folate-binding protein YgfZ